MGFEKTSKNQCLNKNLPDSVVHTHLNILQPLLEKYSKWPQNLIEKGGLRCYIEYHEGKPIIFWVIFKPHFGSKAKEIAIPLALRVTLDVFLEQLEKTKVKRLLPSIAKENEVNLPKVPRNPPSI